MSRTPVLTKQDLRQCGRRWLLGPSTFNYGTQMAMSVVFAEMKALRKIYPDDKDYITSLKNQFKYFNATPPVCPFLLGATLAMEDTQGLDALDAVQDLKVSLMGPISGIGDTVMWALIPTIFGSIAAYMGIEGNPVGLLLYMAANLSIFFGKLMWWNTGYNLGTKIITTLSDKLASFTEAASVMGLTVVGALIATTVNINTGITFTFNDVTLNVQEQILDGIFPKILPIIATIIVYKLIKKNVSLTKIILGIIAISIICAATGILV